jgi:hypothetical protein
MIADAEPLCVGLAPPLLADLPIIQENSFRLKKQAA